MPSTGATRAQREAGAWLRRLQSGAATELDLQGFRRWRAAHPAHGEAFAQVRHQWNLMPEAMAARPERERVAARAPQPRLPRRVFLLGTAASAAGAAAAAVAVHPPLALWPSLGELQADYRTATGEQRTLVLDSGVALQLNTQTALTHLREQVPQPAPQPGMRLVRGEVAVDLRQARSPFALLAGAARVLAQGAQFEVRHLDDGSCVTCIAGRLQVAHAGGTQELLAGQQLRYVDQDFAAVTTVDTAEWSAWRTGLLIFRRAPLAHVIAEINRYRPGKVVLWATQLRAREVSGRFALASLDTVLLQIERSYALQSRSFPGGVLVLR